MPEQRIISADSHVQEPPELYAERLPARGRDRGPPVLRMRPTKCAVRPRRRGPSGPLAVSEKTSSPAQPMDMPPLTRSVCPVM
jgi:hypothetical protein